MFKISIVCTLILNTESQINTELRKDYVGIFCDLKYKQIFDELKKYFNEQPYCINDNLIFKSIKLFGQTKNEDDNIEIENDITLEKYINSDDKYKKEHSDTIFMKGIITFEKNKIKSKSYLKLEEFKTDIIEVFEKIENSTKTFTLSSIVAAKKLGQSLFDKMKNH